MRDQFLGGLLSIVRDAETIDNGYNFPVIEIHAVTYTQSISFQGYLCRYI